MRDRTALSVRFDTDLRDEVEAYVEKHDMQKAEFFEKAAREFMDVDRYSRVEEKLDTLLDRTEGAGGEGGLSRESAEEKKEIAVDGGITATESTTNDVSTAYDPDVGVSGTLSTDELRSILTRDEPKVNVDDIGTLPRSTAEKSAIIAAVVRYQHSNRISTREIKDTISDVVGSSDHLINTYLNDEPVVEHLYPLPSYDSETLEVEDTKLWVPSVEEYRSILQSRYEDQTAYAETAVWDNCPHNGYDDACRWLEIYRSDLVEYEVATTDEVEAVRDALDEHRQRVDVFIRAFESRRMGRDELAESCELDEDTTDKLIDAFVDIGFLRLIDDDRVMIDDKPPRRSSHNFS